MFHRVNRVLSVTLAALACFTSQATAQVPDSVHIERLAGLGKLWAAVKYFHPALASSAVDWDSALVVTIPKVRTARTSADYKRAIEEMLVSLRDRGTRVLSNQTKVQSGGSAPTTTRWAEDSTLVITIADPTDVVGATSALNSARQEVKDARNIVFDLRAHGMSREPGYVSYILTNSAIRGLLATSPITSPSVRTHMYSGFPTQAGSPSGGYWRGFAVRSGDVFTPAPDNSRARRVGFIIDDLSDVPPIAFGLQQAGIGVIVAEGEIAGSIDRGNAWTMELPDSVTVQLRLTEMISVDGFDIGQPDTSVTAKTGSDPALAATLQLLRAPARTRAARASASAFVPPEERAYAEMRSPALEYRLLGAFRFWSAIEYFYPYKNLMGEDWNRVLRWAIPKFEAADDSTKYGLAIAELVAKIHDSHGAVNSNALRQFRGAVPAPVRLKYVEGQPVVIALSADVGVQQSGIRVGDVVVTVDGQSVQARRARLEPYTAASTSRGMDRTMAVRLLMGAEGSTATLVVRGADGHNRTIHVKRSLELFNEMGWARPGPTWKILPGNIGYVDLEKLTVPQVDTMFDALKSTRAIIFDNRSYPQVTAWSIAPRLTDRQGVVGARFQRPIVMTPDTSQWSTYAFADVLPRTDKWRYHNPTLMLVDENTISQAEHTGLLFEAANGTRFVGSPSVGADGDVTEVILPGGVTAAFSGHDVRHADGRQLQRVGLRPDVTVKPTIAGIRAGRDEVLERAIRLIQTSR